MMKSLKSSITESVANRSLPSLPFNSRTRQKNAENMINAASSNLKRVTSLTVLTQNTLFKDNTDSIISKESTSRRDSDISFTVGDKSESKLRERGSFNRWSHIIHYEKLDSMTEEINVLKPKDSVQLPRLLPIETEFLQRVTEDNVAAVQAVLRDNPHLNINCVNFQGVSALHIAVKNRSEAMVAFLLKQPNIEIGDTIMHAVRENHLKILVRLLDAQKEICPGLEFVGCTHSPDFPEHVTPLMMAAQSGRYETVALLAQRGHTVAQPHPPHCSCEECKESLERADPLRASSARLAVYRAVAAPAYIVHESADPILEAFRLTRVLEDNAAAYRQLAAAYLQLRDEVSAFAVDLIGFKLSDRLRNSMIKEMYVLDVDVVTKIEKGCCRTSEEVETVLKQACCQSRRHFKLARLLMAVDYKQKEFVAHPSTQLVLESYWLGNWYSWKSKSLLSKGFIIINRVFITPLILFMCMVAPRHRLVRHYQIPLNKLITHAAAYFVFLALVFHISNQDKTSQKRGPPNTGAEGPVVLYVCGYIWSALRMCVMQGPTRYFSESWNLFDVIMLLLFVLTFALWIAAASDVAINNQENLERKYWNQYDPTLLAEGTFCLATILAYFRLMLLCQLNYHIGPLQVSLGKMTVDIFKYLTIFAIIISAFAAGLSRLYQYYDGMVYEDNVGMKTMQVSSFTGLADTLNTLFWALFCLAPLESADVVLENRSTRAQAHPNHHSFTERIGYLCFGCFEVISVIVVLNMLIATMSNTFQRVINNVATEWTFGKTEVYLNYIWQTTLPSPYNLVPTAAGMRAAAEWLVSKLRNRKTSKIHCSYSHVCFDDADVEIPVQTDYPVLMSLLVQRYFRDKESQQKADMDSDIETLRRDVIAIRALLEKRASV